MSPLCKPKLWEKYLEKVVAFFGYLTYDFSNSIDSEVVWLSSVSGMYSLEMARVAGAAITEEVIRWAADAPKER